MARNTSFYYAFLVLPADQRRAMLAVWDFCRAVDDAVDEAPGPPKGAMRAGGAPGPDGVLSGRAAVSFWSDELARCFDGGRPQTEQGRHLQPLVSTFGLPRQAFDDVIDGVAMDLDTACYATFDDLYQYCRRVASAVGLICIRIFGCRDARSADYALNLGVALQLTNILRDVKGDLDRGRIYLPLDDLAACGCTEADLEARVTSDQVRRVVAFECRRAREFYERARQALPPDDRGRLVAAEIMRAVYFETLRRIERSDYDVFNARLRVPRPWQAVIALRQWLRAV
jgi:15-cis-phytoene synthase